MFNYGNMFSRLQQMGQQPDGIMGQNRGGQNNLAVMALLQNRFGGGQLPPGLRERLEPLQARFGGMMPPGLQGLFGGQQGASGQVPQQAGPQAPMPPVPQQSLTNFQLPSAPMAPQVQMPSFNMASAPIDVSDPSKAPAKRGFGRL